jgi:hypothetical protein
MARHRRTGALVALLLIPTGAHAEDMTAGAYWTGNQLLTRCHASRPIDKAACASYIAGIVDLLSMVSRISGTDLCVPDNTTLSELIDKVNVFYANHDKLLSNPAAGGVMFAIREAYHCGRSGE